MCAFDKIKYTIKLSNKNLLAIISKKFLLSIPLIFILVLTAINDSDSHLLDTIQYTNKIPTNIHMDFDPSNDSKKINLLYSQKIILDDFFTNPKMINNIEKKLASKKTKTVIYVMGNQAQSIGPERRNGFISEFQSARPNSEIFEVLRKWDNTEAQEGVEVILYLRSDVKIIANGWDRGTINSVPETTINEARTNVVEVSDTKKSNTFTSYFS